MKHFLAPLILLLLNTGVFGQTNYAEIGTLYGLNPVLHGDKEIGQVWTLDQVKTKFGAFYTRKKDVDGFTDAQILTCRVLPAAYLDYMVKKCAFGPAAPNLVSVVNIALPAGKWLVDLDLTLPYGTVMGQGTFVWYPTNDASTQLVMDNAGWQGTLKAHDNKPLRTLLISPTYGQEVWTAGYHESMAVRNVRLTGGAPQWMDPSYCSYGLYVYDMGETGDVSKIYAENFNTAGFAFERGTPATATVLTAFNCNYTGIHLLGSALATMEIAASVDDCPSMWHMDAARGREAGGTLTYRVQKKESGVTPEDRGPWKGTIVGYCQGQFTVHVTGISNASAFVKINTAFLVNPRLTNGTVQRCSIEVSAYKGFNCDALVQDVVNKKMWKVPADYAGLKFFYTSDGNASLKIDEKKADALPCKCADRLGFFKGPGTFDYVNCLPKYSYTGPQ